MGPQNQAHNKAHIFALAYDVDFDAKNAYVYA